MTVEEIIATGAVTGAVALISVWFGQWLQTRGVRREKREHKTHTIGLLVAEIEENVNLIYSTRAIFEEGKATGLKPEPSVAPLKVLALETLMKDLSILPPRTVQAVLHCYDSFKSLTPPGSDKWLRREENGRDFRMITWFMLLIGAEEAAFAALRALQADKSIAGLEKEKEEIRELLFKEVGSKDLRPF